jgi:hypothetical protein
MKANMLLLLFFTLALLSCKKNNIINLLEEDNGCIEKIVIPVRSRGTLSTSDYTLISSLFTINGINQSNLRFMRTYRDSLHTYNGTYDFRWVNVLEYRNSLPIFTGTLNYSFRNGIFESYAGNLLNGITPNTKSSMTPGQLRKLFVDDIELFNYQGNQYKDSCFNAEFGYFNLNSSTGNNAENIVKAWHLTPKFRSYPEGYYQDNGQRIYYFDGIDYNY